MTYAQIDKKTGEVLNIAEFSDGLNLPIEYDWQTINRCRVSIGCFYIDGKFFEADKITEISRDKTANGKISDLYAEIEKNAKDITTSMLATADLAKTSSDKYTKLELAIADLAKVFFGGKK